MEGRYDPILHQMIKDNGNHEKQKKQDNKFHHGQRKVRKM
jgi:hypothetical protein